MEKGKSKKVIIAVVCIVAAAGITLIFNNPFAGTEGPTVGRTFQMLCVNEKCGHAFEMKGVDYRERLMNRDPDEIGPLAMTCPKCGEESAFSALKCEKCGEVFIPDRMTKDYPDRCPKCGYSASEEKRGSRRRK